MSGTVSLVIVALANVFMVWRCVQLYKNMDVPSARRVNVQQLYFIANSFIGLLADKL
jgi:protoheme IX farnesyltransferase